MAPAPCSYRRIGCVYIEPLCDARTVCGGFADELSDVGPSTRSYFHDFSVRETHHCV